MTLKRLASRALRYRIHLPQHAAIAFYSYSLHVACNDFAKQTTAYLRFITDLRQGSVDISYDDSGTSTKYSTREGCVKLINACAGTHK